MSSLLYYSISSNLTKDEIIEIDRKISKNRETVFFFVRNLTSNAKNKTRKVIVVIILGNTIFFSNPRSSEAVGLNVLPEPVIRVQPSYQYDSKIQIEKVIPRKKDRIVYKSPQEILFGELYLYSHIYLMDDKFLRHPEINSIIRELRGGNWQIALMRNAILVAVLYTVLASRSEGFMQQQNPGWRLENNKPESPGLVRPADCETKLYAEYSQQSLKTEASRNQPNPKDRWILLESRPPLVIRRGQARFKTKDHGALVGLPYKKKW